tara:strand:- start:9371 stop:10858 length:1488 start_codon:yes stop_codon:yes gene_type:complete
VRVILIGLISALFIFFPLDSVYADSEDIDVSIGFDFSFGELLDEEKVLSGTVISSEEEIIVSWDIQNSTSFKFNWGDFNILSESLTEISDGYFSLNWEVSVDPIDYYSCSCEFNIFVIHNETIVSQNSMPFFILNEMYVSDSNYSMLISTPNDLDWINGDLVIEAQAKEIQGIQPSSIQIYLNRYVTFAETCGDQITYSEQNTINPQYRDDFSFTYNIDMSSKPDGWYELIILIQSNNSLLEYDVYTCMSLKLNNLSPVISIVEEPLNQYEDNSEMIIDASQSEDPIWSEDELYYIWTCTSSKNSEIIIHEGLNQDIFILDTKISGDYTLQLEIMDLGGLSSREEYTFSVNNMLPITFLFINGLEVSDGEEFEISSIEEIIIDGSNSVDTENDIDNLRCIWSVNTVAIFEGCDRELIWPESNLNDESIVLRLDVMDDDGDFSSVTVKLINPNVGDNLPYPVIILLISFLFLISSVFYRFRKESESSSIPKWTKGK